VHQHVSRQAALVAGTIVAVCLFAVSTFEGFLSSVQPQVPRQVAFLARREPAVLTRVHHHPRHALWHAAATCPEASRHHASRLVGLHNGTVNPHAIELPIVHDHEEAFPRFCGP
jgi:hypothetical protein